MMKIILIPLIIVLMLSVGSCGGDDTCPESDKFCHSHDGLNWSDASSDTINWDEAVEYCKDLGGRLPTISELRTLIQNCPATETGGECGVTDSCLSSSACRDSSCDGCSGGSSNHGKYSVFGDTGFFWSSSVLSDILDLAWRVDLSCGRVDFNHQIYFDLNVRCVQ
jgi:hypothetical protein